MKTLISTLISAFAATSVACPTFNGTYLCKGDGLEQTLNVKTEVVNGVSKYSIDETVVLADGKYRKVKYQGGVYDIAAQCSGQTLAVNVLLDGGVGDNDACGSREAWDLLYTLKFTPKGQNMTETHSATTVCESGKQVPSDIKGSMNCVKK